MPGFYERDLARVHSAGFSDLSLAGGAVVLEHLRRSGVRGGEILDLGCGAGEWASSAVANGFDVLGVDVSPAMVELARARVPSARFVAASLWDVEFPAPLVAVTAFGEALNYGTPVLPSPSDLPALFGRAAAALAPRGVFAFDVVVGGQPMSYRTWTDAEEYTVLVEVGEDPAAETMRRSIVVFSREEDAYHRSDENHALRVYNVAHLERALTAAGFTFSRFDSYGGSALGPRRAAFLAERA